VSELVNVIFQKGVLFDINIGKWAAQHRMTPQDLMMDKVNSEAMHIGFKRLMPSQAMKPIIHLEGQIRGFVDKMSMPFPISGAVFVNYKILKPLINGLKKYAEEYQVAATELYNKFEDYKAAQLKVLDAEAEKIANSRRKDPSDLQETVKLQEWVKAQRALNRSLYPAREDLPLKFYVTWRMFKVNPLDGGSEISGVEAEDMAAQQELFQKEMQKWVKEQTAKIHKTLGEAAARAKDLLEKQGKLNPKNLKPLFDAFAEFKAVDFAGSGFQQAVVDIESKYLMTASDGSTNFVAIANKINEGDTDSFAGLLETLGNLAVDAVSENAAHDTLGNSDFKRLLDL
jgi:hypothetical protein